MTKKTVNIDKETLDLLWRIAKESEALLHKYPFSFTNDFNQLHDLLERLDEVSK
jgi:hypothetical protein